MNEDYEVVATIPMQVGRGKFEDGPDNTKKAQLEKPGTRNEKHGYITIQAERTTEARNKGEEATR